MTVFSNTPGNNTFSGTSAEYDQVDYQGSLTDYIFTRNDDGSVTVTHPTLGTDTLHSIEGFWFSGESQWYSLDEAIELTGGDVHPLVFGTNGNDTLIGSGINNTFIGSEGNDQIDGNGGDYNQVDYDGSVTDYTFAANSDGSVTVTHPQFGTDTLKDIDGFWFTGEEAWYSLEQAMHISPPKVDPAPTLIEGTDGDDVLIGTDGDDVIFGGAGIDTIIATSGADRVDGGPGDVFGQGDILTYADTQEAIRLDANGNGFLGAYGDTFINIETLIGSDFDDTIESSGSLNRIFGGDGNDTLIASGGDTDFVIFSGGEGDDTFVTGQDVRATFSGEGGADTFIIKPGSGDVTVMQFDPDSGDRVDISAFGIDDFSQLNIIVAVGGPILDLGNGDRITFDQFGGELTSGDLGLAEQSDVIKGTDDDDVLIGTDGDDTILGLAGSDTIIATPGADFVDGGSESEFGFGDRLTYADTQEAIRIDGDGNGFAGAEGDVIENVEWLIGSEFDDVIESSEALGRIWGGGGNDTLITTDGVSAGFSGGEGDDIFIANANTTDSSNTFAGDGGADTFIITPGSGRTTIFQFNGEDGDRVNLDAFGFEDFNELDIVVTRGGTTLDLGNGDVISFDQIGRVLTAENFGLPQAFIEGRTGNDTLIGADINNVFFGGAGDDIIDGNGGDYNQADYFGSLSDYAIFANDDGSVTVSHAEGTDTLTDIDGFWFGGDQEWFSLESAIAATPDDILM